MIIVCPNRGQEDIEKGLIFQGIEDKIMYKDDLKFLYSQKHIVCVKNNPDGYIFNEEQKEALKDFCKQSMGEYLYFITFI